MALPSCAVCYCLPNHPTKMSLRVFCPKCLQTVTSLRIILLR